MQQCCLRSSYVLLCFLLTLCSAALLWKVVILKHFPFSRPVRWSSNKTKQNKPKCFRSNLTDGRSLLFCSQQEGETDSNFKGRLRSELVWEPVGCIKTDSNGLYILRSFYRNSKYKFTVNHLNDETLEPISHGNRISESRPVGLYWLPSRWKSHGPLYVTSCLSSVQKKLSKKPGLQRACVRQSADSTRRTFFKRSNVSHLLFPPGSGSQKVVRWTGQCLCPWVSSLDSHRLSSPQEWRSILHSDWAANLEDNAELSQRIKNFRWNSLSLNKLMSKLSTEAQQRLFLPARSCRGQKTAGEADRVLMSHERFKVLLSPEDVTLPAA